MSEPSDRLLGRASSRPAEIERANARGAREMAGPTHLCAKSHGTPAEAGLPKWLSDGAIDPLLSGPEAQRVLPIQFRFTIAPLGIGGQCRMEERPGVGWRGDFQRRESLNPEILTLLPLRAYGSRWSKFLLRLSMNSASRSMAASTQIFPFSAEATRGLPITPDWVSLSNRARI